MAQSATKGECAQRLPRPWTLGTAATKRRRLPSTRPPFPSRHLPLLGFPPPNICSSRPRVPAHINRHRRWRRSHDDQNMKRTVGRHVMHKQARRWTLNVHCILRYTAIGVAGIFTFLRIIPAIHSPAARFMCETRRDGDDFHILLEMIAVQFTLGKS